ncbi:XRE family transcriptional regulator [Pseudomonas fluorescens]|nr:XRE family transcriptional regulator [Pseudomonas fluorescens]
MDIGQIIRSARKAKKLSLEELAHRVDSDSGNLSRLERGLQSTTPEKLKQIMTILDIKLSTQQGSSSRQDSEMSNVQMVQQPTNKPRKYPLIHREQIQAWAESSDNFNLDEEDMHLESTEDAGDRGFWMVVAGDYMACGGNPSFPEGSHILVKPGAEVVSGKYYVVVLGGKEQTFKQYVEDAGHKYLRPLNTNYRTIEIDDNCHFIGRVIDAKMTGL